jgi:hypothetical protein
MKRLMAALALAVPVLMLAGLARADDKDKDKDKDNKGGPVAALPPSDLDGAFEKATNPKEMDEGLLNNALYKKAVAEALKAKMEMEQKYRDNPKLKAQTPAQAARQRFLEVLQSGTVEEKPKDKDKDKDKEKEKDKDKDDRGRE